MTNRFELAPGNPPILDTDQIFGASPSGDPKTTLFGDLKAVIRAGLVQSVTASGVVTMTNGDVVQLNLGDRFTYDPTTRTLTYGAQSWQLPAPGLNEGEVDARIAPYARAEPQGVVPYLHLPVDIARLGDIPRPSDHVPGNTPGSPSAGLGQLFSRDTHDHGIVPGLTPEDMANALDQVLGSPDWRTHLSGQDLVDAIDDATGGMEWRQERPLRTAQQIADLLDGLLGTGWRMASGGTHGVTAAQATDAAGALLAALGQFTYDQATQALTFTDTDLAAHAANANAHHTRYTNAEADARARARYTDTEKAKLSGIEDGATQDQTGQEIASALDGAIGTTWRQGDTADPTEQRVLEDVDVGAGTVGKLVIEDGQGAFLTREITHPRTPNVFTSAAYTSSNYLGIMSTAPITALLNAGDWYIESGSWTPRRIVEVQDAFGGGTTKHWRDGTFASVGLSTYRGEFVNEADANSLIQANGDTWLNTTTPSLQVVSGFVAGQAGGPTEYQRNDLATHAQAVDLERRLGQEIDDLAHRAVHDTVQGINNYLADTFDTAPFRVYQADGVPGILNPDDLDGDYLLVLKDPMALVDGVASLDEADERARIDELRIFIGNQAIRTEVHAITWTYVDRAAVIPFSVDATEETGARSRVVATGNVVWVVTAYSQNGAVGNALSYTMPINAAFQIDTEFELTANEKLGLVSAALSEPAYYTGRSAAAFQTPVAISFDNPELIPSDLFIQVRIGGQAVLARTQYNVLTHAVINVTPNATQAAAIAQSVGTDDNVTVELTWTNGAGQTITTRDFFVPVIVDAGVDETARDNAAAAQRTADANTVTLGNMAVFGQYTLTPAGLSDADPPDFMALTLSTKRVNKVIDRLQVNMGGVIMYDARRIAVPVPPATDPLAPFNFASNNYQLSGGVVNLAFKNPADKRTFSNAAGGTVAMRDQFIEASVTYTFTDGTGQTDRMHFGVNNNAFRSTAATPTEGGLDRDQVDARIAPYARATPSGQIADAQIPAGIARVAQVTAGLDGKADLTTVATEVMARREGDDIQGIEISNSAQYATTLDAQQTSAKALLLHMRAAISGTRSGNSYSWNLGDVLYFRPGSDSAERLFTTFPGAAWAQQGNTDAIPVSKLSEALAADSVIINDVNGNVAPDATNLNKIRYNNRSFFRNQPTHYTDPTATYRALANTDLPAGYTLLGGGVYQITPNLSGVADNAVFYSLPAGHWNRKVTVGGSAFSVYWTPNFRWRGAFNNESDADQNVRGVGDVVVFGGSARVVASYTPRTPDAFSWVPLEFTPLDGSVTREKLATDAIPQLQSQVLTYAATVDMDVTKGYTGLLTLTGNTTFDITKDGRPGGTVGEVAELLVTQDAAGNRTLTLDAAIRRYAGVAAPVLTSAGNSIDHLLFKLVTPTAWYYIGQKNVS